MLAGELPWDKPVYECNDFLIWVKNNNYQKSPWCKIENTALSLLRNILNYNPALRFTIKQIKSSTWFVKIQKTSKYEPLSQSSVAFLSQPTHFYLNDTNHTNGSIVLDTGLEVTDSQQSCRCSTGTPSVPFNNLTNHVESFSQPISTENMFLNSQVNATQYSQYGSASQAASQSPLLKLVKRMTRMFVHLNVELCGDELKKLLKKYMYDYKETIINDRQRQITVTTSDKRQTLLTFKVNISEMKFQHEVLVDFRLSKGDGLEFKKIFMKIKSGLADLVCKRYVFVNNMHGCCDNMN